MCVLLTKCTSNDIATEYLSDKFEEKIIKPFFKLFTTIPSKVYLYSSAEQFTELSMILFGFRKADSTHHTNFKYSFTSKGIRKTIIFR